MVNQASLQALINRGGGIAATILGSDCQWYRASDALTVIAPSSLQGSIKVRFDPKFDFGSAVPGQYNKPVWAALCDRTLLRIGDYLLAPEATYFVAGLDPLLPTMAVQCNSTVSIYRPGQGQQTGRNHYGGNTTGYGQQIMAGWPASILLGPKGERDDTGVQGSPRQPWVAITMPAYPNLMLNTGDILTDNLGRRYAISGVELTGAGYRLTSAYEGT